MHPVRVRMVIEWFVPVAKTRFITDALHRLMVAARAEPGCVGCSVTTDVGDRGTIRYVEDWQSEADIQRQFRTERFTNLVALVEDGEEAPFVEFELPTGIRGLDYVEEVCRHQRN